MINRIQTQLNNLNIDDKILHFNKGFITTKIYKDVYYKHYKVAFLDNTLYSKYYPYGSNIFDVDTKKIKGEISKFIKSKCASLAGIKNFEKNKDKVLLNLDDYYKESGKSRSESLKKWKDSGGQPWNKGLTKLDDERIMRSSLRMIGENNPIIKYGYGNEAKLKQSNNMKKRILSGQFTPNTNNRLTHFDIEYCGRRYRSSWEVCFHSLFPSYEYETLRIEYTYNDSNHIYIVDFVDHITKNVVEIKPSSIMKKKIMQIKQSALKDWCSENGYIYTHWDENTFKLYSDEINLDLFCEEVKRKLYGILK